MDMAPRTRHRVAGEPQSGSAPPRPGMAPYRERNAPVAMDPGLMQMLSGGGGAPPMPTAGPSAPAPVGMQGDPTMPADPGMMNAQMGGGSPEDEIIWQAFPSTDPNIVGQLLSQAQAGGIEGMMQVLPALQSMQQQDEQALAQRQQGMLQALLSQLQAPAGNPMSQPGPAVGGEAAGGY